MPVLTEAELKLLQSLVYQECGMHFDERRTHFLQDRLQRRLKECQLDSFYSYYRLLISHQGKNELAQLLENLMNLGCAPVHQGDVELRTVERDRCADLAAGFLSALPLPGRRAPPRRRTTR